MSFVFDEKNATNSLGETSWASGNKTTFQENFNNNLTAMNASQIKDGKSGISLTGINTGSANFVAPSATVETGDTTSATLFGDQTIPFAGAALLGNIGITKIKAVINMSIDQNNSETISNPKLFALDGETATLTQGNTQFVKLDAATGQDAALQPLATPSRDAEP